MPEFKTLDTRMGPPEFIRRGRVGGSELVKDESVEIWDNTVEKSARTRGVGTLTLIKPVEPKFEGV